MTSGAFMTPVVSGSRATLMLRADKRISGSTGCNTFTGSYFVAGSRFTMNIGPLTLAPCETSELTAQQSAITPQVPQVRPYRMHDNVLVLLNETGRKLFTYNPRSS
jgi:heat shock protein HslJ